MKKLIRAFGLFFLKLFYPRLYYIESKQVDVGRLANNINNSYISKKAKVYGPMQIGESKIDDYSYISGNSVINQTQIGKFCSIGPNFISGFGIHPTNGISTSPIFYSTQKQSGTSFTKENKIKETLPILIGNDVFIGMNVIILDGVTIGDGAVIGAGAVVSKNIPPYAIAVGSPIKIIRYRFNDEQISKLLKIQWWNFDEESLREVEYNFFDIENFINKYYDK